MRYVSPPLLFQGKSSLTCHFSLCSGCTDPSGPEGGEGSWVGPDPHGRDPHSLLHTQTQWWPPCVQTRTHPALTLFVPGSWRQLTHPCCSIAKAKCDSWTTCGVVGLNLAIVPLQWAYAIPRLPCPPLFLSASPDLVHDGATNTAVPAQSGGLLFRQLSTWEDFQQRSRPIKTSKIQ